MDMSDFWRAMVETGFASAAALAALVALLNWAAA